MRPYRTAARLLIRVLDFACARPAADVTGLLFVHRQLCRRMSAARDAKRGGAGTGSVSKLPDFQMSRLRALNAAKVRLAVQRG